MKRRRFLVSSLAASSVAQAAASLNATPAGATPAEEGREYYELRRYNLRRGPQQQLINDYFQHANIPALNRRGIKPVGVFDTLIGPGSPTLDVLAAHPTVESAITIDDRLTSDPEYLQAGAAFINSKATEPSYERAENFLLRAFSSIPKMELPPGSPENKPRIFELRTYQSHNKKARAFT